MRSDVPHSHGCMLMSARLGGDTATRAAKFGQVHNLAQTGSRTLWSVPRPVIADRWG